MNKVFIADEVARLTMEGMSLKEALEKALIMFPKDINNKNKYLVTFKTKWIGDKKYSRVTIILEMSDSFIESEGSNYFIDDGKKYYFNGFIKHIDSAVENAAWMLLIEKYTHDICESILILNAKKIN